MTVKQSKKQELSLIVAIEAATPAGGIAVASVEGALLAHRWRHSRQPVSRWLLAGLDGMLREENFKPAQIKAVAVSHGPGSFTGLRIGLALAKTLAQGWNVPLFAYSTLEITARRFPLEESVVCVMLDARRGELYTGLYRLAAGGQAQALQQERAEPLEVILESLVKSQEPVIYFSGDGATIHREKINACLGERARWIGEPWNAPGADALALAGAVDLRLGRPSVDPLEAVPVYLRLSDAEKHWFLTSGERGTA